MDNQKFFSAHTHTHTSHFRSSGDHLQPEPLISPGHEGWVQCECHLGRSQVLTSTQYSSKHHRSADARERSSKLLARTSAITSSRADEMTLIELKSDRNKVSKHLETVFRTQSWRKRRLVRSLQDFVNGNKSFFLYLILLLTFDEQHRFRNLSLRNLLNSSLRLTSTLLGLSTLFPNTKTNFRLPRPHKGIITTVRVLHTSLSSGFERGQWLEKYTEQAFPEYSLHNEGHVCLSTIHILHLLYCRE